MTEQENNDITKYVQDIPKLVRDGVAFWNKLSKHVQPMNPQTQTPSFNNAQASEVPKPWKQLPDPTPIHVVQMIPIDSRCKMLMLHRSNLVRSAKNMWSFPSGIHDIGETMHEACRRELKEEFSLEALQIEQLGTYDNIIDEEFKFHWVISVFGVRVNDVREAINKEPDKHDLVKTNVHVSQLAHTDFWMNHNYHSSFTDWMKPRVHNVISQLLKIGHYPPTERMLEVDADEKTEA